MRPGPPATRYRPQLQVPDRKYQQTTKSKAPASMVGAFFVPRVGAPGGIRTHNPWVRSPLVYMLFHNIRYKIRTTRATGGMGFMPKCLIGTNPL